MLFVPVFWNIVLGCAPFMPVRNGTLFGFTIVLRLLVDRSGVLPWIGNM